MDPKVAQLLRKLPLDKETVASLVPVVGRYGAQGAVVLARSYLGPVAVEVERRHAAQAAETAAAGAAAASEMAASQAPAGAAKSSAPAALKPVELALLGMALTKAVFEAGELALHNPRVAADGKQPEFKLDENGSPPAFSLAHVVAAVRQWRERSPAAVSAEARPVSAPASRAVPTSPARARLDRARAERYAAAPRYTYAAPTPNPRVPR